MIEPQPEGDLWWETEDWDWIDEVYWEGVAAEAQRRYDELVERWGLGRLDCE